jgi:hypothetical protein
VCAVGGFGGPFGVKHSVMRLCVLAMASVASFVLSFTMGRLRSSHRERPEELRWDFL